MKCPKCETPISSVTIRDIEASAPGGTSWRGIAYVCPYCHVIINVEIDPIALKSDVIAGVLAGLKQH